MRMLCCALVVVLGSIGSEARAQDAAAAAEIAFDKGRQLMTDGKYAEACTAFEQSQALDPQIGTRYNIGLCLEKQGKLTSAWIAFREVARKDTNETRRKDATKHADALTPRLTKLHVTAAATPPGFAITINGNDATKFVGVDFPVDPGRYSVIASATGLAPWSMMVDASRGEGLTVEVKVPVLKKPTPKPH
jgi:hypothetical protein